MAIKSKNSNPQRSGFWPWLSLWLGIVIFCTAMFCFNSYYRTANDSWSSNQPGFLEALSGNYEATTEYQDAIRRAYSFATYDMSESKSINTFNYLQNDNDLITVWFANFENGYSYTNSDVDIRSVVDFTQLPYLKQKVDGASGYSLTPTSEDAITGVFSGNIDEKTNIENQDLQGALKLPLGYELCYFWNGEKLAAPLNLVSQYYNYYNASGDGVADENLANGVILVAKKADISPNSLSINSIFYWPMQLAQNLEKAAVANIIIVLLSLAAIVFGWVKWRQGVVYGQQFAKISGWLFLEVKILLAFVMWLICFYMVQNVYYFSGWLLVDGLLLGAWIVLVINDVSYNHSLVFKKSFANWAIKAYQIYEHRYTFQKAMLNRFWLLFIIEFVILTAGIWLGVNIVAFHGGFMSFCLIIALLIGAIGLLVVYQRRLHHTVDDIGRVVDQISRLKNGALSADLDLKTNSDFYQTAIDLKEIRQGIDQAVEERLRSEKMKLDLITNVSHDLKTPLTSIIGYVDLLKKEQDLPDHVQDYIKVLNDKSLRLKTMVQDIFDVSKATSGNLDQKQERIDLPRLVNQTLADMDEKIKASGLVFKVDVVDIPTYIWADGSKLYRVLQNLLTNALQYSLPGSRVFVEFKQQESQGVLIVRNTSKYEMSFAGEDVMERFVRGDKARTSEGSGLGLAIVKSFVDAGGGQFKINIDADLFTAVISYPIIPNPQPGVDLEQDNQEVD